MTSRVRIILAVLLLATLSCQAAARGLTQVGLVQPSPTASPTRTSTPTATLRPTHTATSSPLPPTATASFTPSIAPSPTPIAPTPTVTETLSVRPASSTDQLEVFEALWKTVNENYLYPDFNGADWNAVHEEFLQRVKSGLTDEEFYVVMAEMVDRLNDDHSTFFSPSEAKAEDAEFAGENDYVGIGVLTSVVQARQRVTVILVFPGSPAEKAGLKIHDSILAVDGTPILSDEGFRRNLLRGPDGSTINLTVQTPGEAPREAQVVRRRITGSTPVPSQVLTTPDGRRIGYILLATFNDTTVGEQVGKALREMGREGKLDGLILDNRENGGGADNVLKETLSYFTKGTLGYFINRQEKRPLEVSPKDVRGSQSLPLVVLVGSGTASFGEIFAGVLKDIGRATLIGRQTDGNVEILWIYDFLDGSRAWIAHDSFRPLNHPDENWEETGITPDNAVESNWDEVTMESDPVIRAALAHFDGN